MDYSLKQSDYDRINKLAFADSEKRVANSLKTFKNPMMLHIYVLQANEVRNFIKDSFTIPKTIMDNENCDLGTAFLLFECLQGYEYLVDESQFALENETQRELVLLINLLYKRITEDFYTYKLIKYQIPLEKENVEKMKKLEIPEIFFSMSPGKYEIGY